MTTFRDDLLRLPSDKIATMLLGTGLLANVAEANMIQNAINAAVVFKVDNVAEYMHGLSEWSTNRAFPNIAPLFETMWLEFRMPNLQPQADWIAKRRVACLVRSFDQQDGWMLEVRAFIDTQRHGIASPKWELRIDVAKDGVFSGWIYTLPEEFAEETPAESKQRDVLVGAIVGPCLMAISFMHCKNVDVIENVPPKLPMTKKRAQHPPRTKFYTLNIKPMQRILEDEGQASKIGLKMALHICRGHFKDYSNGGGLFGKYKGMYWWDSQVRGDRKHGEVVKDYKVQPQ